MPPGMIRTTSTDMVKRFGDESILYNWMRNRNTIEFLGIWEQIYNPHFKPLEFERFSRPLKNPSPPPVWAATI